MHQIYNSFQEVNEVQMEINFLEAVLWDGPRAHVLYYVGGEKTISCWNCQLGNIVLPSRLRRWCVISH